MIPISPNDLARLRRSVRATERAFDGRGISAPGERPARQARGVEPSFVRVTSDVPDFDTGWYPGVVLGPDGGTFEVLGDCWVTVINGEVPYEADYPAREVWTEQFDGVPVFAIWAETANTTPAPPDTSIQYNENGAFGGSGDFTYNYDSDFCVDLTGDTVGYRVTDDGITTPGAAFFGVATLIEDGSVEVDDTGTGSSANLSADGLGLVDGPATSTLGLGILGAGVDAVITDLLIDTSAPSYYVTVGDQPTSGPDGMAELGVEWVPTDQAGYTYEGSIPGGTSSPPDGFDYSLIVLRSGDNNYPAFAINSGANILMGVTETLGVGAVATGGIITDHGSGTPLADDGDGSALTGLTQSQITDWPLGLADGGTEADLSATGPGLVEQSSTGAPLSVLAYDSIPYVPTTSADWAGTDPATIQEALDRLAAGGGTYPIP